MTPRQALAEALRRWGREGSARTYPNGDRSVGKIVGVSGVAFFMVEGQGKTFADAFKDVDSRAERARVFRECEGTPCPDCSRTLSTAPALIKVLDPKPQRRVRELDRLLANPKKHRDPERPKWALELYDLLHPHHPKVVERDGAFVAVCRTCLAKTGEVGL